MIAWICTTLMVMSVSSAATVWFCLSWIDREPRYIKDHLKTYRAAIEQMHSTMVWYLQNGNTKEAADVKKRIEKMHEIIEKTKSGEEWTLGE